MTKLIWHSNAPFVPTGYGQQTALFAPLLAEHYETFLSANYGLDAAPITWKGITVLPGIGQTHGDETLPEHVGALFDHPRDGLVFTLYDVDAFDPKALAPFNSVCWTPVDHNPVPPGVEQFFRHSSAIPIAMSRYGEQELAEFEPLYVPHAIECDVYKPTPSDTRRQMGIPEDAFLIGMVAANKGAPSRKSFQEVYEAFRIFRQRHDDAFLYVHTHLNPMFAGGEDVLSIQASLGIPPDAVKYPNQYQMLFAPIPREEMARRYSAFDVLVNPAKGEGFGIPVLEAQSCGVPVIVSDFSAMPEVGKIGWHVGGRPFWSSRKHSWLAIPDVEQIVDSLEKCYALSKKERTSLSKGARAHALNYALPKVFEEHMLPALKEAEQRFETRKPVRIAPREQLKAAA